MLQISLKIEDNVRDDDVKAFYTNLFSILCDQLLMDFDMSEEDKKQLKLKLQQTCDNHRNLLKGSWFTPFEQNIDDILNLIQEYEKSPHDYDVFAFKRELSTFFDTFYFDDEKEMCFQYIRRSQKFILDQVVEVIAENEQIVNCGIFALDDQCLDSIFRNLCKVLLKTISIMYPSYASLLSKNQNREIIIEEVEKIKANARLNDLYQELDSNFGPSDFEKEVPRIIYSLLNQCYLLSSCNVYKIRTVR